MIKESYKKHLDGIGIHFYVITVGQWEVKVKTTDIQDAGTHAQVIMRAFGTKGCSDPLPLGKGGPKAADFDQGKESTFSVSILTFH